MKLLLIALFNETRKGLLIIWAYKINFLGSVLAMAIAFVGISFMIGNGQLDRSRMAWTLLGYLMWNYVLVITGDMGENLMIEAEAGTLEQMFISPIPFSLILVGRSLANMIISFIQILLIGAILIALMDIPLTWSWDALPVIIISIVGLFGLGVMLAGLTLIFKRIYSAANIINNVLVFVNGALIPIEQFPAWMVAIADVLPTTLGISVLRSVLLNNATLIEVWNNGSLPLLIVHSTAYLVAGLAVLQWCKRVARRQGILGQY